MAHAIVNEISDVKQTHKKSNVLACKEKEAQHEQIKIFRCENEQVKSWHDSISRIITDETSQKENNELAKRLLQIKHPQLTTL